MPSRRRRGRPLSRFIVLSPFFFRSGVIRRFRVQFRVPPPPPSQLLQQWNKDRGTSKGGSKHGSGRTALDLGGARKEIVFLDIISTFLLFSSLLPNGVSFLATVCVGKGTSHSLISSQPPAVASTTTCFKSDSEKGERGSHE